MANDEPSTPRKRWIKPIRFNVLFLLIVAYVSLIALMVIMVSAGVDAMDAYDKISVPFVALVGGTLAVAKDLV